MPDLALLSECFLAICMLVSICARAVAGLHLGNYVDQAMHCRQGLDSSLGTVQRCSLGHKAARGLVSQQSMHRVATKQQHENLAHRSLLRLQ